MTPEQEVIFWREFYAESIRLFGDKNGTFKEMMEKAMERLHYHCYCEAVYLHERKKLENPINADHQSGFNRLKFIEDSESKFKKDWNKSRPPTAVLRLYFSCIYDRSMSNDDAIKEVKSIFKFPSYMAAYQFLKREGVKGLPSTWPSPD